jgi:hypothetical protein
MRRGVRRPFDSQKISPRGLRGVAVLKTIYTADFFSQLNSVLAFSRALPGEKDRASDAAKE